MSDFGSIFKLLRNQKAMTQKELADAMKISKSTISMYENGNRKPDFEGLELIADFFKVDINFLIGREAPQLNNCINYLTRQEETLVTSYRRLDDFDKGRIEERIDTMLEDEKYRKLSKKISDSDAMNRVMFYNVDAENNTTVNAVHQTPADYDVNNGDK